MIAWSDLLHAGVLGAIQGATEFLPVSSSGHLILVPWLLGWTTDFGLSFDVAVHMGTLGALLLVFWRDWVDILTRRDRTLLGILAAATVPGAVAGIFLDELAESTFRAPALVSLTLLAGGGLLWIAESRVGPGRTLDSLGWRDGLIIGASQALALIPGISRSGITITAGLLRGLSRETAARFSFLLAAPIVAGAGLFKLKPILNSGINIPVITGIIVSFLVGILAIKLLLRLSVISTFMPFVWYRVVMGTGSLVKVWLG